MQDSQLLTLRNYFADFQSDNNDNSDDDEFSSTFSIIFSTSFSKTYEFFLFRSSSKTSSFERVVQHEEKNIMSFSIHIILNLYFEKTENSKTNYVKLRKILQLTKNFNLEVIDDERFMTNLSLKFDNLKRQVRRHIFLLKFHRKIFTIVIKKQSSLTTRKKKQRNRQKIEKLTWIYWYELLNFIVTILSIIRLRKKMHFDMTIYTDNSIELWNSSAWDSSIRVVSRNVCFNRQNDFIIFENFLEILSENEYNEWKFTADKVIFFDKNHKFSDSEYSNDDEIRFIMQSIVDDQHFIVKDIFDKNFNELFLVEHFDFEISLNVLHRHINVFVDKKYDDEDDDIEQSFTNEKIYVKRIFDYKTFIIRFMFRSHFIRKELEIMYYDRKYVENYFSRSHLSFFYLLFIDDFDVHRNMYRALKTFYLIFVNLSYEKKRKIVNVFIFILDSHDATTIDVVKFFFRTIRKLNKNCSLEINEKFSEICVFILNLIENMLEMTNNENFVHHSAQKDCRSCFCFKNFRENLNFDTMKNDRIHLETLRQRHFVKQLMKNDQKRFLQKTELRLKNFVIVRLCSALNLIQTRIYDASHSKWRKLRRILHSFLITTILSKKNNVEYLRHFQNFQYLSKWSHIQNSTYYIESWSLSKTKRASILLSLILRCHAIVKWFRFSYLQIVERIMNIEIFSFRAIIKTFDIIAHFNTLVESQRHTFSNRLHRLIVRAKEVYQNLIRCDMSRFVIVNRASKNENETSKDNLRQKDEMSNNETAKNNQMINVIDVAINFDFELKFSFILTVRIQSQSATQSKKNKERKSKVNKFDNFFNFFNVHVELHFVDNVREYVIVMNFNVFVDEMKHMSNNKFISLVKC